MFWRSSNETTTQKNARIFFYQRKIVRLGLRDSTIRNVHIHVVGDDDDALKHVAFVAFFAHEQRKKVRNLFLSVGVLDKLVISLSKLNFAGDDFRSFQ